MFLLWSLLFPVLLLALLLVMERVEQPLRRAALGEQLERFLGDARADEVETFVAEGFAPALERYWRRRPDRADHPRPPRTRRAHPAAETRPGSLHGRDT